MSTSPRTIRLGDIAHARSGDKGNHANVGILAYTQEGYQFLQLALTEARIAEFFLPLRPRKVTRYLLPGLKAFNFMLEDVLGGGASRSLRIDSQGKLLGLAVLNLTIPVPEIIDLAKLRPTSPESSHD